MVEMTALGEYLRFRNGRTSPNRDLGGASHPVYGSNGRIGLATETNASRGATVIGRVGSFCGSTYLLRQDSWVTDNAIIAEPLNVSNPVEFSYWYYVLKVSSLETLRGGSGQPLLNQKVLNAHHVKVHVEQAERVRVAEVLMSLDDKIEANNKLASTADALASALYLNGLIPIQSVVGV